MTELQALSGGPDGLQIISPVLTNIAVQFRPHGYVYDQIVAPQPVETNIGQYPVFDPAAFFTTGGDLRVADNAATPIVDFQWSMDNYHCEDFRLSVRVTRKEYQQVHPALRLETSKVLGLLGIMAGNRERRLAEKLRAEANGGKFSTAAVTPVVKWDEGTEGTPATIEHDMKAAGRVVYKKTGWRPNVAVFPRIIAEAIAADPTVRKQIQYVYGMEQLAKADLILPPTLFGFRTIVVDGALENTAAQGASSELAEIWGNSVRLMHVNPTATWGLPTTVYSFRGKVGEGFQSASPGTISQDEPMGGYSWAVVDRWVEPDPPANRIRAWECVDEKVVASGLGVEIQNVLGKPNE